VPVENKDSLGSAVSRGTKCLVTFLRESSVPLGGKGHRQKKKSVQVTIPERETVATSCPQASSVPKLKKKQDQDREGS